MIRGVLRINAGARGTVHLIKTMKAVSLFRPTEDAQIAPDARSDLARRLANAISGWSAVATGVSGNPGLSINAASEQRAVEDAMLKCKTIDRGCAVLAIGPFKVTPKSVQEFQTVPPAPPIAAPPAVVKKSDATNERANPVTDCDQLAARGPSAMDIPFHPDFGVVARHGAIDGA
jgi:hypothetical protein